MDNPIPLALIYGSTRPGRFCDTVANWAAAHVTRHGNFTLDRVDPMAPPLQSALASGAHGELAPFRERFSEADAFLVVTPEYNHGYPAPLKSLIDSFGTEWHAKPVAFVSYGGVSGGLRAVEQLRQVFAELHAVTVRDSVSFASAWDQFDSSGNLMQPERAQRTMANVLAQLEWWAVALRNARRVNPYKKAV